MDEGLLLPLPAEGSNLDQEQEPVGPGSAQARLILGERYSLGLKLNRISSSFSNDHG